MPRKLEASDKHWAAAYNRAIAEGKTAKKKGDRLERIRERRIENAEIRGRVPGGWRPSADDLVIELNRELDAIAEHRDRALDLITHMHMTQLRGSEEEQARQRDLSGYDPLDLAVTALLYGEIDPQSGNAIIERLRAKGLWDGRRNMFARLERLRREGVIKQVKAPGRGAGKRWVHVRRIRRTST